MIQHMPRQSPFKQQLIPPITAGLTAPQAAQVLGLSRQTINSARRKHDYMYAPDCMNPLATPHILTPRYPLGVTRTRKLHEKHAAHQWLKDNLPVKSGSKHEVHTQHDTNYELFRDYVADLKKRGIGKYSIYGVCMV
jgi:hypothetical protein